jgi:hypothetical protein
MIPTIVASLTTGSILMISTLTSAIALSTASVIQVAGIQNSQMPQALITITLLVGTIMFVMGLLRHSGNLLMLAGVEPNVVQVLTKAGLNDQIGKENIFETRSVLEASLHDALDAAEVWLRNQRKDGKP